MSDTSKPFFSSRIALLAQFCYEMFQGSDWLKYNTSKTKQRKHSTTVIHFQVVYCIHHFIINLYFYKCASKCNKHADPFFITKSLNQCKPGKFCERLI